MEVSLGVVPNIEGKQSRSCEDSHVDISRRSAAIIAWTHILNQGNGLYRFELKKLRSLFAVSDSFGDLQLSPLHGVCLRLRKGSVRDMISSCGGDVNVSDSTGRTPLSWAAQRGDIEMMRQCLEAGANINKPDFSQKTPLHWAVLDHSFEAVQLLLAFGVDVMVQDLCRRTPLALAISRGADRTAVKLLLDYGSDPASRDQALMTPMLWAAYRDDPDILELLQLAGADVNDSDISGRTPIHIMITMNNHSLLRFCVSVNSVRLDRQDEAGRDILHFAAVHADLRTLQILMSYNLCGLRPHRTDVSGIRAKDFAHWRLVYNEDWSETLMEPVDPDPAAWYQAFMSFLRKVQDPPRIDPILWAKLQEKLHSLNMDSDDELASSEDTLT